MVVEHFLQGVEAPLASSLTIDFLMRRAKGHRQGLEDEASPGLRLRRHDVPGARSAADVPLIPGVLDCEVGNLARKVPGRVLAALSQADEGLVRRRDRLGDGLLAVNRGQGAEDHTRVALYRGQEGQELFVELESGLGG